MAIPLHLIAGALGVGKTTAIRRYISQSPEYTAVIVNDFGEAGYDAEFIAQGRETGLQVENVPGGCLCCTSAAKLRPALEMFCKDPKVERIIVEPSGVALLGSLLNLLEKAKDDCGYELMPVIVLFDPAKARPAALEKIPYWKHLATCADIVVANRCDLATPAAIEEFIQYFEPSDPPKLDVLQTSEGKLPMEMFELRGHIERIGDGHFHHDQLPPFGTSRFEKVFKLEELLDVLQKQAPYVDRFKGLFQTDEGWFRIEIASGVLDHKSASPSKNSYADWIGQFDSDLLA